MFWLVLAAAWFCNSSRRFANSPATAHRRDRHIVVRKNAPKSARRGCEGRHPRGTAELKTLWRRCEMGTNHIACFGIWRKGSRRTAARVNRKGETRWHMPKPERGGLSASFERSRR